MLGGRGILDVMDAIEEVNNRFRGDRSFDVVEAVEVKPDAAPAAAAPAQAEQELQEEAKEDPAETSAEAPEVEVVDTEKVRSGFVTS